jgi:antitoxin (DNA-binding transcriptional repressor) of toxin-antitoxin stability system
MDYLQYSTLDDSIQEYLEAVEKGKSFIVIKEGKAIAKMVPFDEPIEGWKREIKMVTLKSGVDSLKYIEEDREGR